LDLRIPLMMAWAQHCAGPVPAAVRSGDAGLTALA